MRPSFRSLLLSSLALVALPLAAPELRAETSLRHQTIMVDPDRPQARESRPETKSPEVRTGQKSRRPVKPAEIITGQATPPATEPPGIGTPPATTPSITTPTPDVTAPTTPLPTTPPLATPPATSPPSTLPSPSTAEPGPATVKDPKELATEPEKTVRQAAL